MTCSAIPAGEEHWRTRSRDTTPLSCTLAPAWWTESERSLESTALAGSTAGAEVSEPASLCASAKPPADAQPFAPGGKHRMLAARREKTHQPSRNRRDIPMPAPCIEHPQLAARRGCPVFVQVQHQRYLALRTP